MSSARRQALGLSNWLRGHLISRLSDNVDCGYGSFDGRAEHAEDPAELLPLDAYRGFMDPRDRQVESSRAYRA